LSLFFLATKSDKATEKSDKEDKRDKKQQKTVEVKKKLFCSHHCSYLMTQDFFIQTCKSGDGCNKTNMSKKSVIFIGF
jgi:hypothetical protein